MGRNTSGVKGINLTKGATIVGMVLADPSMSLLTVCENGFGKRTAIGTGVVEGEEAAAIEGSLPEGDIPDDAGALDDASEPEADEADSEVAAESETEPEADVPVKGYRRQRRAGKGLKDIKATARNGQVVKVLAVTDKDDVLMVTSVGKIQRVRAGDISEIGRNTQGVRIIRLDEGDKLASMARIPSDLVVETIAVVEPKSEG